MGYIDIVNKSIKSYFDILNNGDYPKWLLKYIETPELQRLAGIDLFCGTTYTSIDKLQSDVFYSRLDHSIAASLMSLHFNPNNKEQALCALFHDVGTPAFSHAHDFKLNDSYHQSSSERTTLSMIKNSELIENYLKSDSINIKKIINPDDYPVLDKESPALYIDRLEGILSLNLFVLNNLNLDEAQSLYKNIDVFYSEDFNRAEFEDVGYDFGVELCLDEALAEEFYEASFAYSRFLQTKEDKYAMQLLGDILRVLEQKEIITEEDSYTLSEKEIINKIKQSEYAYLFNDYEQLTKVIVVEKYNVNDYQLKVIAKPRVCIPLVSVPGIWKPVSLYTFTENTLEIYEEVELLWEKNNKLYFEGNLGNKSKKLLKTLYNK